MRINVPPREGRDRLIIGVDFGTTFSGCALAYSGDPESADEIQVVKSWPGSNGVTSDKVPSEILYETNPPTSGIKRDWKGEVVTTTRIRWGLEIKPEETRLRCLKLRFDPRQKLPDYVSEDELNEELRKCGKTAEEAISDYLAKIHVVLTVPAVWTNAAKDATLRAAQKAGMGPELYMISEPEAAAIYALKSMGQKQKLLSVGDNFILPELGALCGGEFLNIKFRNVVESRMGPEAFKKLCESKPRCMNVAMNNFENYVKRNYNPLDSNTTYDGNNFNIPFPGATDDAKMGIDSGFFVLSSAEVGTIFRPLVDSIIDLIERQRMSLAADGKVAKGVIPVGGFGQSEFLYRSLKKRFADGDPPLEYTQLDESPEPESESKSPRFVIMQPENSWTAVVRGAVLSNLEDKLVLSRKARRHYGIVCSEAFDAAQHSRRDRYIDDVTKETRAGSQMSWHVKKGQDMPTKTPITLPFFNTFAVGDDIPDNRTVEIMFNDREIAPQGYSIATGTLKLCQIDANFRNIPRKFFKKKTKNGVSYRRLEFEIGMQIGSGSLILDLRVNGIVYGTAKASYE
ncbi:actin-like ATPase domain-containing protein [Aureobasidium subglaciale]|nr:actin-like ATPase domain-containing protein [Aureobasidium subglaciale]